MNELTFKPKHLLSKSYYLYQRGTRIGSLYFPWSQIFIKLGRAKLKFREDSIPFELTFPYRDFGLIGKDRTTSMKLFFSDQLRGALYFSNPDINDRIDLEFSGNNFVITREGIGHHKIASNRKTYGKIKFKGRLLRECSIQYDSKLPREIICLIFWGLVNPLRWV